MLITFPINRAEPHNIVRFHDILVRKKSIPGIRYKSSNKTRRQSSTAEGYRVLPADDSLHNEYYSGKVENSLAHAKINPRSKRQPKASPPPTSVVGASLQFDQFTAVQDSQSQSPLPSRSQSPPPLQSQSLLPSQSQSLLPSQSQPSQPKKKNPVLALFEPETEMDKARVQDLAEIFHILARRDGFLLEQMLSLKDAIERYYGIFEFMGVAKLPASKRDPVIRKILEKGLKNEKERMQKI